MEGNKLKATGRVLRILLLGMLVAFMVAAGSFLTTKGGHDDADDLESGQQTFASSSSHVDGQGFSVTTTTEKGGGYYYHVSLPHTGYEPLDSELERTAKIYKDAFLHSKSGSLRIVGITSKLAQMVSVHLSVHKDGAVTNYTWVYDTGDGVFRGISDFFDEGYTAAEALSDICAQKLSVYTGGEVTEQGLQAAKAAESYELFTLSPSGLCIYIPAERIGLSGASRRVLIAHDEAEPYVSYHIPSTGTPLLWKRDLPAGLPPQDRPYKVAITFDDGPSYKNTGRLLDGLLERDVKATFFMLGGNAARYPDLATRIAEEGHQVGNHSYGHAQLTKLTAQGVANEMEKARAAIEKASGVSPNVVRPPYGAVSATVLENVGAPAIMWSLDVYDWKYTDAQYIYEATIKVVRDGDIILMHDSHSTSVDAALMIIDDLSQKGYAFVTVDELYESRGIAMEAGKKYYHARQ